MGVWWNLSLGVLRLVFLEEVNKFSQVRWLTLVENFVCNEAYFQLYPVPDWKSMEFFQLRGNVRKFRGRGDNNAE